MCGVEGVVSLHVFWGVYVSRVVRYGRGIVFLRLWGCAMRVMFCVVIVVVVFVFFYSLKRGLWFYAERERV